MQLTESISLFPRSPGKSSRTASFKDVVIELMPEDVLLEIADNLSSLGDKLCFAFASPRLYPKVIPSIYASVELDGSSQCENTLSMLCTTPSLARHVRKLVVHPDRQPFTKTIEWEKAPEHCTLISWLIGTAAKNLDALQTFMWDAAAYFPEEFMWAQLRRRCPNLVDIGTTFVHALPSPRSDLFAFSNLEKFSLAFKPGFYVAQHFRYTKETEATWQNLWDMLIYRCPNLRSLCVEGDADLPIFYNQHLLRGKWPSLHSLRLGPSNFGVTPQPFLRFLEDHPSIQELVLTQANVNIVTVGQHVNLASLDEHALPNLRMFRGDIEDLRALSSRGQAIPGQGNLQNLPTHPVSSPLSHTLRTVVLPEPMQLRELTPLSVSGLLVGLRALTSLTIAFSLQGGYDSNGVFRTIVSSCPQLLHLDLTCTCRPSFQLESFSKTLRSLTKLTTLSLTMVKMPGDESMQAGAARFALSNPRLKHFTVAYIPANKPIAQGHPHPQPVEFGRYLLVCDGHGIPVSLLVWESWYRFGGIGARRTRKLIHELRPAGHPDAERKGWVGTLLEKSPAGEEARLLLFSGFLLLLATWGLLKGLLSGSTGSTWMNGERIHAGS